ncbi:MAG: NAD(+)/NADH kinase [Lachnospiraceae bacterium]|nr:NAD(+)/NADH kinase [Lachnospiraceae bacterium]
MKHFFIITNQQKDKELTLTKQMQAFIEEKGGSCSYLAMEGKKGVDALPQPESIPEETECMLVLGGDGTLIRVAARFVSCRIPLIGVNLGTVGYLCELETESVLQALERLMEDNYVVEERMLLTGHGEMRGEYTSERLALNEIAIRSAGSLSILNLIVYVNGKYLHTFHGDGMIVSTPTGSTGYNMSAGGPIVDPKANLLLLTPINAHNLNTRSIVIDAKEEVVVEIGSRRVELDETAQVSFDGDGVAELRVGDRFLIKQAEAKVKVCKLSEESFLEILRKKMQAYS